MSVGVMRCNKEGCNGLVVYEDADYNIRRAIKDGTYILDDDLVCDTCGRKFKAVITHTYIYEDEKTGDFEELESACITEWEKKHRK